VQLDLIGAYVRAVKAGLRLPSPKPSSAPLMAKSIANYIHAASDFWHVINPKPCSIYRSIHGGKNVLHPFIADHLATSAASSSPGPKKPRSLH
jgi:hypothetical protein